MSLQRLKIGDIVKFESGDIWTVTKINENSFDIECLSPGPENIFTTEEKCTEFFDDAIFVILTQQEINQLKQNSCEHTSTRMVLLLQRGYYEGC